MLLVIIVALSFLVEILHVLIAHTLFHFLLLYNDSVQSIDFTFQFFVPIVKVELLFFLF